MFWTSFEVPEAFNKHEIAWKKVNYFVKAELQKVQSPPSAAASRTLVVFWPSKSAYENGSETFRKMLASATGANSLPLPTTSGEVIDTIDLANQGLWSLLRRAFTPIMTFVAIGTVFYYQVIAIPGEIRKYTSEVNLHFVPPKSIKHVEDEPFDISIDIYNSSSHNTPKVTFDSGSLLKDRIETKLPTPAIPQLPSIAEGKLETLKIACPKLAAGEYQAKIKVIAETKGRTEPKEIPFVVQIWAPWKQWRLDEKGAHNDFVCKSRWRFLPGKDYKNLEFRAMIVGVPDLQFRTVLGDAAPETPLHDDTKDAEVTSIRWHVQEIREFTPIQFSLILKSSVARTPDDWLAIQKKIDIVKAPKRTS